MTLPATIGGKYRPREVLGEGAMGIVYSVEHTLTGELLALKVMTSHLGSSAEAIERFKREARAASKIKSQHVVRVLDADVAPELDGALYLVMDLLEGVDLEQLSGDKPVERATVVEWLRQIAPALDKAHRLGIVHRDLKPENLFLTKRDDGSPLIKILDFGIAKIAAESTGTTQSGQILGTPLYMAPEQARGDSMQVGPASDLYALGLIAYKLLTGAPYWTGTSVAAILGEILYEPLVPPSARGQDFGPEFDAWFLRACQSDPAQRFTSAAEQVAALAAALSVPAPLPTMAGASSVGWRDSLPADSASLPPDSSGNVLISPSSSPPAHPDAKPARRADQHSTGSDMTNQPEGPRRVWGRAAFFATAAAIAVLVTLLYRRGPPPGAGFPAKGSSASKGEVVALVAPSPPAASQPATASAGPSSEPEQGSGPSGSVTEPTGRGTLSGVSMPARREGVRTVPVRASFPRAVRREKLLVDDALSDQK